jgi:hypothetical protein
LPQVSFIVNRAIRNQQLNLFLNLLLIANRPTKPPPNSKAVTSSESGLNSAYELGSAGSDVATPRTAPSSRSHRSFGVLGGSHWLLIGTKISIASTNAISNFLPFISPPPWSSDDILDVDIIKISSI